MTEGNIVVAQLGARMHYAVPRILNAEGLLERLYTDICAVKGWPRLLQIVPSSLLPGGVRRLKGRLPSGIPPKQISAFTQFGYEYATRRRRAHSATELTGVHLWAGVRFNELILANGFGGASLVYGFNSASEGLLEAAKGFGCRGVVEQTIAPRLSELRLIKDEADAFPKWGGGIVDGNAHEFALREKREWTLADRILVGSDFVKQQMAEEGGPIDKCVVVPYGVERDHFAAAAAPAVRCASQGNGVLRVLFVGEVGLRKGVHYLLSALERLQGVGIHCRIVGPIQVDRSVLNRALPENVELVGTVPRAVVQKEYAWADVFCFPSLCEGSATVVYEALAAGLPVVTTPNSGSIVRNGLEGFIVPIRQADAIADCLERLAADRMLLAAMSKAAIVRSTFGSLEDYGARLLSALNFKPLS